MKRVFSLLLLASVTSFPTQASAQPSYSPPETSAELTSYAWLSGYSGSIRPREDAPTYKVSRSFGEIFKDLDSAIFVTGIIQHKRMVGLMDFTRTSTSETGEVPTGNPSIPAVTAKASLTNTSLTVLAGYRVVDDAQVRLDLFVGGRAWWIKPSLKVPALSLSSSPSESFIDPIVAARASFEITPRVSGLIYLDAGGFGAASDFTGQIVAAASYRVMERVWLTGGYRYQRVNYNRNGIKVDSELAGPVVGASLAF